MPVAKSDPRRATVIGVVGVIVGTVMILLVLFAGNLGGGDKVHTTSNNTTFDVGPAKDRASAIARDQTPLFFNDTATGSRPIVVNHLGDDPKKSWIAFDAANGTCVLTWHRGTQNFTDCNGSRISADGRGMHQYPVKVENDHVIVDLNPDATTTTSYSTQ